MKPDPSFLARLLVQLGQTSPEVVEVLRIDLTNNDWRVRQAAATQLNKLGR